MTKRIKIYGCFWPIAEIFQEIDLPGLELSYDSFARRQKAIGLEIPATHDMPRAFFYFLFYVLIQGRGVLLRVLVKRNLVVVKDVMMLFHKVSGALEGA